MSGREKSAAEIAAELEQLDDDGFDAALFDGPKGDVDADAGEDDPAEALAGKGEGEGDDGGTTAGDDEAAAGAEGAEGKQEGTGKAGDPPANPQPEGVAKADDGEPTGVQLPSGKIIPYTELKSVRQELGQAKEQLTERERELEALRAQVAAKASEQGTAQPPANAGAEDLLEGLNPDDYDPALVKALRKLDEAAKAAQTRVQQLETERAEMEAAKAREAIQSAIDENDDLRTWQGRRGGLWQDAVSIDAELKADPEWASKSISERFAEVSRRVREVNGLPPPGQASSKTGSDPGADKQATSTRVPIASITDLPGGAQAPVDGVEAIERTSTAALAAQYASLSPEQLEQALFG